MNVSKLFLEMVPAATLMWYLRSSQQQVKLGLKNNTVALVCRPLAQQGLIRSCFPPPSMANLLSAEGRKLASGLRNDKTVRYPLN